MVGDWQFQRTAFHAPAELGLSVLRARLPAEFPGWRPVRPSPAAQPPMPSAWPVAAVLCPADVQAHCGDSNFGFSASQVTGLMA